MFSKVGLSLIGAMIVMRSPYLLFENSSRVKWHLYLYLLAIAYGIYSKLLRRLMDLPFRESCPPLARRTQLDLRNLILINLCL